MVKEGQLLAVFNSTHRVMKAESILKARGVQMLLIPAPRQLKTDCGLAIRFDEEYREAVMNTLQQEKLLPEFIARLAANGYETVWGSNDN